MLIDGRNRREACKLAGVEPRTRVLSGEDPTAYVLSANVHRRNLTPGQRAMAMAMLYPKPEKGGRGKKNPNQKLGFSAMHLSRAVISYPRTKPMRSRGASSGIKSMAD